jgi:hypothetical protein
MHFDGTTLSTNFKYVAIHIFNLWIKKVDSCYILHSTFMAYTITHWFPILQTLNHTSTNFQCYSDLCNMIVKTLFSSIFCNNMTKQMHYVGMIRCLHKLIQIILLFDHLKSTKCPCNLRCLTWAKHLNPCSNKHLMSCLNATFNNPIKQLVHLMSTITLTTI